MNSLPIRRPGDSVTGEPCIIPANVGYCEACDCYRRAEWGDSETVPVGWQVKRFEGMAFFFCPLHEGEDVKPRWMRRQGDD